MVPSVFCKLMVASVLSLVIFFDGLLVLYDIWVVNAPIKKKHLSCKCQTLICILVVATRFDVFEMSKEDAMQCFELSTVVYISVLEDYKNEELTFFHGVCFSAMLLMAIVNHVGFCGKCMVLDLDWDLIDLLYL